MKLLIVLTVFLTANLSWASYQSSRTRPVMIITPSGPVRMNTPFMQNRKDELKGSGMDFYSRAIVKDQKVSVWIRGCNEVLIGDMKETEDKDDLAKLQAIRNGDNLRLKMSGYGKCEVSGWEKN